LKKLLFLLITLLPLQLVANEKVLSFTANPSIKNGKTVVLIAGDEEYRTEESMPMLAKILSQHHGFDTKVIFSWDPTKTYIDPNHQDGLIGLEELNHADLMIIGTRFRKLDEVQLKPLSDYVKSGKPIIGIRTATHAFRGNGKLTDSIKLGEFGLKVLGEKWVSHHGKHKGQGARGVLEQENSKHPILNNVKDLFAPSDVYGVKHLTKDDQILMRGAVTETLDPSSKNIEGDKNNPMMALAWLHPYQAEGKKGLSFCTTAGASVDLVDESLRRLIVNAAYFLTKQSVPEKANVEYVDPFYPSFYGFIRTPDYWKKQNQTTSIYKLGKVNSMIDPPGTPEWNFRPILKK